MGRLHGCDGRWQQFLTRTGQSVSAWPDAGQEPERLLTRFQPATAACQGWQAGTLHYSQEMFCWKSFLLASAALGLHGRAANPPLLLKKLKRIAREQECGRAYAGKKRGMERWNHRQIGLTALQPCPQTRPAGCRMNCQKMQRKRMQRKMADAWGGCWHGLRHHGGPCSGSQTVSSAASWS